MSENDLVTTSILDELEVWQKKTEDPFFITKQLLKSCTCDSCWRLTRLNGTRYICGSPEYEMKDIKDPHPERYQLLPEERTCEFYVPRHRQDNNKKSP